MRRALLPCDGRMTPEEIRALIQQALPEVLYPVWYIPLLVLGIGALLSFAGSFLGAYLKRRGENYATHADFERLLGQLSEQTRATEAIKTEISEGLWNRQQ